MLEYQFIASEMSTFKGFSPPYPARVIPYFDEETLPSHHPGLAPYCKKSVVALSGIPPHCGQDEALQPKIGISSESDALL